MLLMRFRLLCWRRRQIDPGCRYSVTQREVSGIVAGRGMAACHGGSVQSWYVGQNCVGANTPGQAAAKRAPAKRGPAPKWQQQMEQIATLPRAKQQVVMQMLDGLLAAEAH